MTRESEDDYGNFNDEKSSPGPWIVATRLTRFTILSKCHPKESTWVNLNRRRNEVKTRTGQHQPKSSQRPAVEAWRDEEPRPGSARESRGTYYILSDYLEFDDILKNARFEWETTSESAMPCAAVPVKRVFERGETRSREHRDTCWERVEKCSNENNLSVACSQTITERESRRNSNNPHRRKQRQKTSRSHCGARSCHYGSLQCGSNTYS